MDTISEIRRNFKSRIKLNFIIVTNIKDWSPEKIVKFYCKRGNMENFIKEGKNGFAFGKMSSTDDILFREVIFN